MDHARHTIFGAAALSRGFACLLLTLCLIPGAATTAQAFEAGRHAAPPQGAESEYEQQMRTQRLLQLLDDFERLAKEQARGGAPREGCAGRRRARQACRTDPVTIPASRGRHLYGGFPRVPA